ncbi:hypothetical protein N9A10_00765 [Candidatus Pelagibacter sp.]|nr:hypothetical protein [Candidatus Pelagibacter sp.]
MANTYIKRTCDGAYTSTFTWSAWVKRSTTGSYHGLFCNKKNDSNSNSRVRFYFSDADRLAMEVKDSTSGDDSFFQTNKLFRDVNAWYHIVLAYDTTQGAENDRIKLWVNNEEITSWEQFNRAGSGFGTLWSSAMEHRIGTQNSNAGTNYYFDGSMSHVHLTYGTAYNATAFGEYDANGVWKIKTSPSVTYGSQGYFVLKDGNSLTDQSGEGNNFTVGSGTLTKTEDCPSNVFATLNPLDTADATDFSSLLQNGNTTLTGSANDKGLRGTLGASSGKFYWEIKANDNGDTLCVARSDVRLQINNTSGTPSTGFWGVQSNGTGANINTYENGTFSNSNTLQGYASNTIIGIALDMDNGKIYYSFNGVFKGRDNNSSDPVNQTNPFFSSLPTDGTFIMPFTENRSSGGSAYFNFGNGYFGTTVVSSAGTNASGIGIFEYDVPTGYTALSTKGLNL